MTSDNPPESKPRVLHPFFFGVFPLFSLLSANLVWAGFGEVFFPLAIVLAIAAILWLLLWPLLPQPHKRGLALSLFWLPFFGYSTIVDSLRALLGYREMLGLVPQPSHRVLDTGPSYGLHSPCKTTAAQPQGGEYEHTVGPLKV